MAYTRVCVWLRKFVGRNYLRGSRLIGKNFASRQMLLGVKLSKISTSITMIDSDMLAKEQMIKADGRAVREINESAKF